MHLLLVDNLLVKVLFEKCIHFFFALSFFLFFLLLEHGVLEVFTVDNTNKDEEGEVENKDLSHEPEVALGTLSCARFRCQSSVQGVRCRVHRLKIDSLTVEKNGHLHDTVDGQAESRAESAFHACEKEESNGGIHNMVSHNEI